MPINSRQKGARAERAWRDELRAQGYLKARRGQQFSGSPDSPDVVCEELSQFHFEVKHVEKLNVYEAYEQARQDSFALLTGTDGIKDVSKTPIVAHKRNNHPWLVTMSSEAFFRLIRNQSSGFHPLDCNCMDCKPPPPRTTIEVGPCPECGMSPCIRH